ncbi:MAG TPA: hypothetical protein DET40_04630 [Lentisphaeria bacterium]|nr:MAG: hypothetical protein A2X45_21490 [Lentisphaerae bacterium GWF2_50_93]HCE42810.1 hypothetical protein [Lentisphaeria bacterium]
MNNSSSTSSLQQDKDCVLIMEKYLDLSVFLKEVLGTEEESTIGFAHENGKRRFRVKMKDVASYFQTRPHLFSHNLWFNASVLDGHGYKVGNCVSTKSILLDVDYGTLGHKRKSPFPDRKSALQHIFEQKLRPSAIWDTAHGVQMAFLLDRSVHFTDLEMTGIFDESKRRINHAFRGDSTTSREHLFRVPATVNDKSKSFPDCPPAMGVVIQQLDPSIRYSLDEMFEALPPVPAKSHTRRSSGIRTQKVVVSDVEFGKIPFPDDLDIPASLQEILDTDHPEGTRSEAFFRAVLGLYDCGATLDCIRGMLMWNPSFAEKYGGRFDEEIVRCITKKDDMDADSTRLAPPNPVEYISLEDIR